MSIDCQFSIPVNYLGETPTSSNEFFQFQKLNCNIIDEKTELIQENDKSFFLNKSISYGDFLIIIFLLLFLIILSVKFILNFFIPNRVNFKNQ
jgi:hypothetical protein